MDFGDQIFQISLIFWICIDDAGDWSYSEYTNWSDEHWSTAGWIGVWQMYHSTSIAYEMESARSIIKQQPYRIAYSLSWPFRSPHTIFVSLRNAIFLPLHMVQSSCSEYCLLLPSIQLTELSRFSKPKSMSFQVDQLESLNTSMMLSIEAKQVCWLDPNALVTIELLVTSLFAEMSPWWCLSSDQNEMSPTIYTSFPRSSAFPKPTKINLFTNSRFYSLWVHRSIRTK